MLAELKVCFGEFIQANLTLFASMRFLLLIFQLISQPDNFANQELQVLAPGSVVVYSHAQAMAAMYCGISWHRCSSLLQAQHDFGVEGF